MLNACLSKIGIAKARLLMRWKLFYHHFFPDFVSLARKKGVTFAIRHYRLRKNVYLPWLVAQIQRSGLFGTTYYLATYTKGPVVIDPLLHYILRGDLHGLNPNAYFLTNWYRKKYIGTRRINTLLHFCLAKSDNDPSPWFSIQEYKSNHPEIATARQALQDAIRHSDAKYGEKAAQYMQIRNPNQWLSTHCACYDYHLPDGASILDFGCGNGEFVCAFLAAGFDAYGVDIYSKLGEPAREHAHRFSTITIPPDSNNYALSSWEGYRLPYPDNFFDCVVSHTVIEHIFNLDVVLKEIARVLKKDGVSIHTYPYKYGLLERHTMVPLGGYIPLYSYFYLWAALGHRGKWTEGLSSRECALKNYKFMQNCAYYRSTNTITAMARKYFSFVRCENAVSGYSSWIRHFLTRPTSVLFLSRKIDSPDCAGEACNPDRRDAGGGA
jgi:ubiquinone/menaquinone biosynthesis C-methylase UbiE